MEILEAEQQRVLAASCLDHARGLRVFNKPSGRSAKKAILRSTSAYCQSRLIWHAFGSNDRIRGEP